MDLEDKSEESLGGEAEDCRILLMAADGTSSRTGGSLLGTMCSEASWEGEKMSSGESRGEAAPIISMVTAEKDDWMTG